MYGWNDGQMDGWVREFNHHLSMSECLVDLKTNTERGLVAEILVLNIFFRYLSQFTVGQIPVMQVFCHPLVS